MARLNLTEVKHLGKVENPVSGWQGVNARAAKTPCQFLLDHAGCLSLTASQWAPLPCGQLTRRADSGRLLGSASVFQIVYRFFDKMRISIKTSEKKNVFSF